MHRIDDNESRTYLLTELTVPRARQVVATSAYLIARWASEYNMLVSVSTEDSGQRAEKMMGREQNANRSDMNDPIG